MKQNFSAKYCIRCARVYLVLLLVLLEVADTLCSVGLLLVADETVLSLC